MFKLRPRDACLGLLHIHLQLCAASTAFALRPASPHLHSAALWLPRPATLLRPFSVAALRQPPPVQALYLRGGSRQETSRKAMSSAGNGGAGGSSTRMIRTPKGMMSEQEALDLFAMAGFTPPPGASIQEAFELLMELLQEQMRQEEAVERPGRGRTAKLPEPPTAAAAEAVLATHGASVAPITPCGCEIKGMDLAGSDGKLGSEVAGALEVLMAVHGFVLFRNQGRVQNESGISGKYLLAEQQCSLSENFGAGKLHSTHGVHPEAPCRDIFRLSNDPNHGFNSVGPEWHNDGSFCREVFGHVVYHIVKAPSGAGSLCVVFAARDVPFSVTLNPVCVRVGVVGGETARHLKPSDCLYQTPRK